MRCLRRAARGVSESNLLWVANAESGIASEWAAVNDPTINTGQGTTTDLVALPSGRISQDTTFKASGTASYKIQVLSADTDFYNPTTAQRTEIATGNPTRPTMLNRTFNTEDERWIAWQVYLDPSFPINSAGSPSTGNNPWCLIAQAKQLDSFGSPIVGLQVFGGNFVLTRTTNDPQNQTPQGFISNITLGAAITGAWCKFLLHELWHPDPTIGFTEWYGDIGDGNGYRQLLPLTRMSTQKIADNSDVNYPQGTIVPCQLRMGIYRDIGIGGTTALWIDSVTVARSRRVAELNAFGF